MALFSSTISVTSLGYLRICCNGTVSAWNITELFLFTAFREICFLKMGPKKRGRPKSKKAAPPPEDSADEILSDDLELKELLLP